MLDTSVKSEIDREMKRREILKRIAAQAKAVGVRWEVQREGANDTVYRLGATTIPVPPHIEIGPGLSEEDFQTVRARTGRKVVEMTAKYRATVVRDGRFWLVRIDGVGSTQARHLGELDEMANDLIGLMTDDDLTEFDVEYDICLPAEVQGHLQRSEELRAASAKAQAAAAVEVRIAARLLHQQGMGLRDVGKLLGVSHQRAHQLVS